MRGSAALRWEVLAARVTFLHDRKPAGKSWWHLMHGSKAPAHSKKGSVVEETGEFEGHKLTLLDQPHRIDLLIGGDPSMGFPDRPILSRVTFDMVVGKILPLISKLTAVAELPAANRVAFGIALSQAHSTREEAIQTIAQIFPGLSRELEQSADFLFQINHPRKESIGDLTVEINPLHKWFLGKLNLSQRRPKSASAALPMESYTANVEMDMSTAPAAGRKWSANEAAMILQYLIKAGRRLLEDSPS